MRSERRSGVNDDKNGDPGLPGVHQDAISAESRALLVLYSRKKLNLAPISKYNVNVFSSSWWQRVYLNSNGSMPKRMMFVCLVKTTMEGTHTNSQNIRKGSALERQVDVAAVSITCLYLIRNKIIYVHLFISNQDYLMYLRPHVAKMENRAMI